MIRNILLAVSLVSLVWAPYSDTRGASKRRLVVELDFFEDCTYAPKPEHLRPWFKQADIKIVGERQGNEPLWESDDSENRCPEELIHKSEVAELLQDLRNKPNDDWYAQGLVLPHKGMIDELGKTIEPLGILWLDDSDKTRTSGGMTQIRQSFVVFQGGIGSNESEILLTTVHELIHVLNAHHCDFGSLSRADPEKDLAKLLEHLSSWKTDEWHVKPGGDPWCDDATEDAHRGMYHEKATRCCGEAREAADDTVATIKLATEQSSYRPGEPIYVDIEVQPNPAAPVQLCVQRDSLTRSSTHLQFEVGDSGSPLDRLPQPIMIETRLDLEPLPDTGIQASGIGIWYGLSRRYLEWSPSVANDQTILAKATYVLYGIPGGSPEDCRVSPSKAKKYRIASKPVKFLIDRSSPPRGSYEANTKFTLPLVRRGLWLGGRSGDSEVLTDLATNARFKDTVYSTYAQLALGQALAARRLTRIDRYPAFVPPDDLGRSLGLDELNKACDNLDRLPPALQQRTRELHAKLLEELGLPPRSCGPPSP